MVREPDAWVSQFRKGVVEVAVLGLLASQRRYGSQIVDDLAGHPQLAISAGTVYPLLARMKKAGVIDSMWEESPVGPPRKYYRLTDEGREALGQMTAAWTSVSGAIDAILQEGGTSDADQDVR